MLILLEFIINLIKVWYKMQLVIEMLHKKPCSGTQEIVTRKIIHGLANDKHYTEQMQEIYQVK